MSAANGKDWLNLPTIRHRGNADCHKAENDTMRIRTGRLVNGLFLRPEADHPTAGVKILPFDRVELHHL